MLQATVSKSLARITDLDHGVQSSESMRLRFPGSSSIPTSSDNLGRCVL